MKYWQVLLCCFFVFVNVEAFAPRQSSSMSLVGRVQNRGVSTKTVLEAKKCHGLDHLNGKAKFLPALLGAGLLFTTVNSVSAAELKGSHAVSVFTGSYDDPNHPGCLREITNLGTEVTITGSDKANGADRWKIQAKESFPGTLFVDFSPKGGPKNLLGVYDEQDSSIRWPDGNKWSRQKE